MLGSNLIVSTEIRPSFSCFLFFSKFITYLPLYRQRLEVFSQRSHVFHCSMLSIPTSVKKTNPPSNCLYPSIPPLPPFQLAGGAALAFFSAFALSSASPPFLYLPTSSGRSYAMATSRRLMGQPRK